MKVTVKFRGGPLTAFFPHAGGKSAIETKSLLYLSVRGLSCSYLPVHRRSVPISRGSFPYRSYLGRFT